MSGVNGYTSITSSTSSQTAVPPAPGGATKWLLTVEGATATAAVRWRADGTAPTSTVGHYLTPGKDYVFDFEGDKFKVINDTAATTNCTLHFHWLAD